MESGAELLTARGGWMEVTWYVERSNEIWLVVPRTTA